jgi:hypothetical protein
MQSRSLWLGSAMSSCSPAMPTRELDSLEESLLVCLYYRSPLVGGGFLFSVFLVLSQMQGVHTVLGISGGANMYSKN